MSPRDPLQVAVEEELRCYRCHRRRAVPNRRSCDECLSKAQERHWTAVAEGLCRSCRKAPAESGKVRCATCSEKVRQESTQRYQRTKQKGLCTYCRHQHAMPHKELCFGCFKKKARLDRARYQRQQRQWLGWILVVVLWTAQYPMAEGDAMSA